jgi:hypothetical protein
MGNEVCENFLANLSVFKSEWEVFAVCEFVVFVIVVWWVRKLQEETADALYMKHESKIIFPIHKTLLIMIGLFSLFQALVIVLYTRVFGAYSGRTHVSDSVEILFAFLFGSSAGLNGFVLEGSALLFLSPGIGYRSIKKSGQIATVWCCYSGFVFYYYFLSLFSTQAKYQRKDFLDFVDVLHLSWEVILFFFYLSIYFTSVLKMNKFRPAAIMWSRFWVIARLLILISIALTRFYIDAGACLYALATMIFFVILKIWVAFWCYRLEARWWHGDVVFSDDNLLGCGDHFPRCYQLLHSSVNFVLSSLGIRSRSHEDGNKEGGNHVESDYQTQDKLERASPLVGVQLSGKE